MAVTRIKNNQITDSTIVANAKLTDYSISSAKLANNLVYGSDLTVTGNLTVQGNATAIDTTITTIEDPVIVLASTQTSGTPTVDIGFLGYRGNQSNIAFVWDESADEFVTAFTSTGETNTTVTISSYADFHTNNANIGGNLTLGGNLSITGNVSSLNVTGNITGGNLLSPGLVSATGNVTGGNVTTAGAISATGNINSGANIVATANVIGGNVTTGGQVVATGNVTGGNLLTSGVASATGNINSGANIVATANVIGGNVTTAGVVSATGNVSGGNVLTSGLISATSTITSAANITGGNVLTGGLISATGTITSAANITGGNLLTAGQVSATGDLTTAGNVNLSGNIVDTGALSIVTGSNGNIALVPNGTGIVTVSSAASITGNVTGGNVLTGGVVSATGNVTGGNITTGGAVNSATVSASGNVTGGNVLTGGVVSATGNVTGGNVLTGTLASSGGITITTGNNGNINLQPNGTGNIVLSNTFINSVAYPVQDQDAASKIYVDNMVSTQLAYHEAVFVATTANLATTTGGTITYNNGNAGVGATITTTGTFNIIDTANVQTANTRILVKNEGNAALNGVYVWSNATVITRSADADQYGPNSADQLSLNDYFFVQSGNVNKGSAWIVDAPTGVITFGTSNIGFAQFSQSQVYSANTDAGISLNGTTFSAKVDNNTTAFDVGGNIIVKAGANLTTPNIGAATGTSLSVTGNVTGGNLNTGGLVSATGNLVGGNVTTAGLISATGNATAGNVLTAGQVSAAGNVSGANINLTGNIVDTGALSIITGSNGNINLTPNGTGLVTVSSAASVTGNVTGGNVLTGGVVSATGNINSGANIVATANVIGGNITTAGVVSATGNINSGANIVATANVIGGNVTTAGLVSATGNVTGGNVLTGGVVSATGNINSGANIVATANVIGGNVTTAGLVSATGNVTGGNLTTSGLVTATGNVTAGNVNTGGLISATGNILGGNLILSGAAIDSTAGRITVNSTSADTDFAVNGDTVANVFYVDAGTGTASFGNSTQVTNAIVAFNATNSIVIASGNTAQRPGTGVTGMLRFNTTNNSLEIYDNSQWSDVGVPSFTVIDDEQFNGDGSTVAFTLGSTQTTDSCIVSINGVVQIPTLAYSVAGTFPTCVLTFTEAPAPGDLIDVRQITTTTTVTSIANSPGNAVIAVSPTLGQVNVTGDLLPVANVTHDLGSSTLRWRDGYFSGNSIILGNIVMKNTTGNTIGFFGPNGTTPATLDANVAIVGDEIAAGTSNVSFASSGGNVQLVAGGTYTANITSTGANVTGTLNATGNITGGNVLTGGLISATGNITGGNINLTGNIVDTGGPISIITTSNGNIGLAPNGTGNVNITGNVMPTANATANIGSATLSFNTIFARATSAQYADLAEKYVADAEYTPGTVVVFGGSKEVTVSPADADTKVAGVVSTNPSYIMNGGLEAEYVATVALTGRVPCRVTGTVRKGDIMVSAGYGLARAEANPRVGTIIGKALADFDGQEGVIEVVVGRF